MEERKRLPISAIKQYAYCKRRFALMFIDIEWESNYKIIEGNFLHEKVDNPFLKESRGDIYRSRSVPVYSERLNIQGVCDIIEFTKDQNGVKIEGKNGRWRLNPMEYKNGKPEKSEADNYQLCAIAMCLEEMFKIRIEFGDIFYGKLRRRTNISFTDELRQKVEFAITDIEHMLKEQSVPKKPAGQNCSLCSLKNICMPKIFDRQTELQKLYRFRNQKVKASSLS